LEYDWPGNVRQLRNVLEQAAIDSAGPVITAELLRRIISLSFAAKRPVVAIAPSAESLDSSWAAPPSRSTQAQEGTDQRRAAGGNELQWETLEQLEKEHIARTLKHTFFNRSAAARLLGVTRQSLLRKMKRHGLDG
jgi:DNA-binding NtrC family response regulator